jgi:hypothetical protein
MLTLFFATTVHLLTAMGFSYLLFYIFNTPQRMKRWKGLSEFDSDKPFDCFFCFTFWIAMFTSPMIYFIAGPSEMLAAFYVLMPLMYIPLIKLFEKNI